MKFNIWSNCPFKLCGSVKFAYLMFHSLGENVFVKAAGEVALQQLVIIDCLGNHSPHKLEVVQVVGVDVGKVVDCVGYPAVELSSMINHPSS
jgi:hypothetical protein